jgi:hypothetical protein
MPVGGILSKDVEAHAKQQRSRSVPTPATAKAALAGDPGLGFLLAN